MKLVVGLGNPGANYANTRHNIGFILVDALAGSAPWRDKFQGLETRISVGGEDIRLLKPMTFMNLSGQSVAAAAKFYKIAVSDILVIHDELDLLPGKVKSKTGGGHAGHNGLRSITQHMGADFARLRVGIGHPGDKNAVSNYVLNDFSKSDQKWIDDLAAALEKALPEWVEGGIAKLQNRLSQELQPPQKGPAPKRMKPAPKPDTVSMPGESEKPSSPFDALKDHFRKD